MKLGYFIDNLVSKIGLRFICYSTFRVPEGHELDYLNTEKPEFHTPDIWGYLQCGYCGRIKRFHKASKLPKSML